MCCRQEHLGSDLQSSPSQEAKHPHSPGFALGQHVWVRGTSLASSQLCPFLCQYTGGLRMISEWRVVCQLRRSAIKRINDTLAFGLACCVGSRFQQLILLSSLASVRQDKCQEQVREMWDRVWGWRVGSRCLTMKNARAPLSPLRLNQMTSFSEAKDRSRWIKLPTQENEDVYSFCYFYKNRWKERFFSTLCNPWAFLDWRKTCSFSKNLESLMVRSNESSALDYTQWLLGEVLQPQSCFLFATF